MLLRDDDDDDSGGGGDDRHGGLPLSLPRYGAPVEVAKA